MIRSREEVVARAVREWVKQLVDLTGRNRLLYYRTLKRGTLELTHAEPLSLRTLLGGRAVKMSRLLPATEEDPTRFDEALANARVIHRKARTLFEERGIETLFAVVGLVQWTTDSTAATPSAPLLMAPVELSPTGAGETDYSLTIKGDWTVNDTLVLFLRENYGVTVDSEAILQLFDPGQSHQPAFDEFCEEAATIPDVRVADRCVVGTFQYTKLPMVRDLEGNVDKLVESDMIAAVAGDAEAGESIRSNRADVDPSLPNETPPADEFLVLDADSSQNRAVNAAVLGESLVVQGPPGTGKSQTIANLIATLTARGKRVLFVAEKRAAIDAVKKRLDAVGLGDVVMDLHGGVSSRKRLAEMLAASLDVVKSVPVTSNPTRDHRLTANRKALLDYSEALHRVREPFAISVFEAFTRLPDLEPVDLSLLAPSQLRALDEETVRQATANLAECVALRAPFRDQTSPWTGAAIDSPEQADAAFAAARELGTFAGDVAVQLDQVLVETGLPSPDRVGGWEAVFGCFDTIEAVLDVARPEIFDIDLDETRGVREALHPGHGKLGRRAWATVFNSRYRDAGRRLREHWAEEKKPSGRDLVHLADDVVGARQTWGEISGQGRPCLPRSLAERAVGLRELQQRLAALGAYFVTTAPGERSHSDLPDWSRQLIQDRLNLNRIPRVRELDEWLRERHLGELLDRVEDGSVAPGHAWGALEYLWFSSIVSTVIAAEPVLANFDGGLQTERALEFARDDRAHVSDTPGRVQRSVAEHAVQVRNENPQQDQLIHAQAKRKRGHLPLRELFRQADDVLVSLRPCWTMSPLLVSEVLPPEVLFDVAIFDEASQVMPADAVPTMMRATQVIVAGDDQQLPPTSFFDTADTDTESDDEDEGAASLVVGYESILDVLGAMLRSTTLTWHYRSEDERLIAFSNHAMYKRMLITFPGTGTSSPLQHVLVPNQPGLPVDTRSSDAEVEAVVQLMIDHAYHRPEESLGVIAMGIYHADRIDATLRRRIELAADPELDEFFSESHEERAFVKNLERVQGDERDAIILSIGYTKQADGRLMRRFGPLNHEGGERRLNVAVTRARRRLTLVSGFSHIDLGADGIGSKGAELLRSYLRYVESGGIELGVTAVEHPLNPFELDVLKRLERAGLRVVPQYGVSGYRIDFAVAHPEHAEKLVLAVEADGASYHSSPTARDRDRLRQQMLERLGWHFHRIWSTDWFRDPEAETRRVLESLDEALEVPDSAVEDLHIEASEAPQATRTGRPSVRPGLSISQYSHAQLVGVARWIMSDTLLRTRDELVAEMMMALGFRRRGERIINALGRAADEAIRSSGSQ